MPILVFLDPSVVDLWSDVRDRQADVRRASSLNASPYGGGGITMCYIPHIHRHDPLIVPLYAVSFATRTRRQRSI